MSTKSEERRNNSVSTKDEKEISSPTKEEGKKLEKAAKGKIAKRASSESEGRATIPLGTYPADRIQ